MLRARNDWEYVDDRLYYFDPLQKQRGTPVCSSGAWSVLVAIGCLVCIPLGQ
jgi:hypothetical protein